MEAIERQFYWYDNGEVGTDSFSENSDKIDVISPQIYEVGFDLKLHELDDRGIIEEARDNNIKIVPLVHQKDFSRELMSVILLIPKVQDAIIEDLVDEALVNKYDGWQYDFENIAHKDRDKYTKFVERSAKAFEDEDLEFSVAVVPRTRAYNPYDIYQDWSSAYDYRELAKHADYLSVMAYDDPNSAGPSASADFSRQVVDFMQGSEGITGDKLSLGIPLYCWKWRLNGGLTRTGSLTHQMTDEDREEAIFGAQFYNENLEAQMNVYVVQSRNVYLTWCSGDRGLEDKIDIVKDNDLRGFSAWAIGQEPKGFWNSLE